MAKGGIIRAGTHTQPMQGKGKCSHQLAFPSVLGRKLPWNVHHSHFKCWFEVCQSVGNPVLPCWMLDAHCWSAKFCHLQLVAISYFRLAEKGMWVYTASLASEQRKGWGQGGEWKGHSSQISAATSFILSFGCVSHWIFLQPPCCPFATTISSRTSSSWRSREAQGFSLSELQPSMLDVTLLLRKANACKAEGWKKGKRVELPTSWHTKGSTFNP